MKRVIALGFFDGLHRGHAALIHRSIQRAKELGAEPCVLSFDRPPMKQILQINTNEDKIEGIKRIFGIDSVIMLTFDDKMRTMPWQDFAELLINEYGACHLVAGYDFRFGYKGEGDTAKLRAYCMEHGVGFDKVEKVTYGGVTVSSTYIRELIEDGEIRRAGEFLGHMHYLSGTVQHGRRLGRTLGFPTVNLALPENLVCPKYGVYATEIKTGSGIYRALTNVGVKPTVQNSGIVSIESNLFGFDGDLYGERIRLDFMDFIRPERKFSTIDELRRQIEQDTRYFN